MKLINYRKKWYFLIFFIMFNFLIFGVLNLEYNNDHTNHVNNPLTSGITSHLDEQWIVNPTFIAPVDPWYPAITGDVSDVITSTNPNQANYVVIGDSNQKQVILNSTTSSNWIPFNKTKLIPNLGNSSDPNGVYTGHDWDETDGPSNNPSINWKLSVNMGVDMSDYIITSVAFEAVINATVDQDIDTPGDTDAKWITINFTSALNQSQFFDYAQFYIEISDLSLNEINTYRIAFNQTRMLGNELTTNYNMQKSIESESEQTIINVLNRVLSIDPGHNNFAVILGIKIYCEDNVNGSGDRDQWDELRFKTLNLTISYEKKISRFTTVSWNQDLNKITGSHIKITTANLSFKFKIDQNWPPSSHNSVIRIFINDRRHEEAINLSNYVYSPSFQEAKIGGLNISSKILPYENFTLSIQLVLTENFGLGSNITISITDVYLYVSYTEFFPDILNLVGPFLLAGIFFAVSIVLASLLHRTPKQRGLKDLSFTTGYPKVVKPDKSYWLSVYLHLPKYKDNIAKLIDIKEEKKGFDTYIPIKESIIELKCAVTLRIIPNVKDITFEPIKQEITWYKDTKEISFRLKADPRDTDQTLTGTIDIFKENLFIGQIPLFIRVSQDEEPTKVAKTGSRKFESVFMSYSYCDEDLVVNFKEAYESLGIEVITASGDIYSGKWPKQLENLIFKSDVFQLYWSAKSKDSPNVTKEWKQAIKLIKQRGEHFFRGCYWQIPMPILPKKLEKFEQHLHKINWRNLDLKSEIKEKLMKKP